MVESLYKQVIAHFLYLHDRPRCPSFLNHLAADFPSTQAHVHSEHASTSIVPAARDAFPETFQISVEPALPAQRAVCCVLLLDLPLVSSRQFTVSQCCSRFLEFQLVRCRRRTIEVAMGRKKSTGGFVPTRHTPCMILLRTSIMLVLLSTLLLPWRRLTLQTLCLSHLLPQKCWKSWRIHF